MSAVDEGRIVEKLAYIRGEEAASLRCLEHGEGAFLADPTAVRAAKYSLVTAIEAVIDIAYHLCAKAFRLGPRSAHEAFDRLCDEAVISRELAERLHRMVGFRNRLVHAYDRVADERLPEFIRTGQQDFADFQKSIEDALRRL